MSAQAIAEGFGDITLARDSEELLLRPGKEGRNFGSAEFLPRGKTVARCTAVNVALDIVKCANLVQRLAGDPGFVRSPDIVEVTPEVRPTGCFLQSRLPIGVKGIKLGIAFISIRLQDAAGVCQLALDMDLFPIRGKRVEGSGWGLPFPWALVADVGPYPPFRDAFSKPLV